MIPWPRLDSITNWSTFGWCFFVDPSESDSDGDPHPTHGTVSAAFTTAIDDTLWMGLGPWDSLHKLGPITMVYYGYNYIYIYPLITGSALPSNQVTPSYPNPPLAMKPMLFWTIGCSSIWCPPHCDTPLEFAFSQQKTLDLPLIILSLHKIAITYHYMPLFPAKEPKAFKSCRVNWWCAGAPVAPKPANAKTVGSWGIYRHKKWQCDEGKWWWTRGFSGALFSERAICVCNLKIR